MFAIILLSWCINTYMLYFYYCKLLCYNYVFHIKSICRKTSWHYWIMVMETTKVPGSLLIPPYSRLLQLLLWKLQDIIMCSLRFTYPYYFPFCVLCPYWIIIPSKDHPNMNEIKKDQNLNDSAQSSDFTDDQTTTSSFLLLLPYPTNITYKVRWTLFHL